MSTNVTVQCTCSTHDTCSKLCSKIMFVEDSLTKIYQESSSMNSRRGSGVDHGNVVACVSRVGGVVGRKWVNGQRVEEFVEPVLAVDVDAPALANA